MSTKEPTPVSKKIIKPDPPPAPLPIHSVSEHTPGPWIIDRFKGQPPYLIANETDVICLFGHHPRIKNEEVEANARLIAVAPDLRKLADLGWKLSTWAAAINWGMDETNTKEWLDGLRERINIYQAAHKAAIDKAEEQK